MAAHTTVSRRHRTGSHKMSSSDRNIRMSRSCRTESSRNRNRMNTLSASRCHSTMETKYRCRSSLGLNPDRYNRSNWHSSNLKPDTCSRLNSRSFDSSLDRYSQSNWHNSGMSRDTSSRSSRRNFETKQGKNSRWNWHSYHLRNNRRLRRTEHVLSQETHLPCLQ